MKGMLHDKHERDHGPLACDARNEPPVKPCCEVCLTSVTCAARIGHDLLYRFKATGVGGHSLTAIAAFFDDRQRAWRHLLHLRGELSTTLVSARLGGENVAGCVDPPSERKCRMEARRVDRETAEPVAGGARPIRRAAALVRVRADQESRRSPARDLIIFALLWMVSREPRLYLWMHRE
jgi:hypothetical protein